MENIAVVNAILLFGAALMLVGILSSLVASRFGAPLLLVFLLIGMLSGEDGPGGIAFDNYRVKGWFIKSWDAIINPSPSLGASAILADLIGWSPSCISAYHRRPFTNHF